MTDGTIEQRDGRVTFRYRRLLNHPIDRVWRAITDPAELSEWLGAKAELDLRVGGVYALVHRAPDGSSEQRVEDKIVRLEPPRLFEHTFWLELNPSALVTWELTPTETGTRLDLTHAVDLADLKAAGQLAGGADIVTIMSRNGAGWHRILDLLGAELDGTEPPSNENLRERYAAMLS